MKGRREGGKEDEEREGKEEGGKGKEEGGEGGREREGSVLQMK